MLEKKQEFIKSLYPILNEIKKGLYINLHFGLGAKYGDWVFYVIFLDGSNNETDIVLIKDTFYVEIILDRLLYLDKKLNIDTFGKAYKKYFGEQE